MEFRKMVTITLYVRQQKRHRCIEQSFGLCGRGRGWDDLGEWHQNMYNIIYEMSHQFRFDAETGCVPPVSNFKEVDPELGTLNLSKGGAYPVEYALRLAAGFGSQISMALLRWVRTRDGIHRTANALGYGYRIADEGAW